MGNGDGWLSGMPSMVLQRGCMGLAPGIRIARTALVPRRLLLVVFDDAKAYDDVLGLKAPNRRPRQDGRCVVPAPVPGEKR